MDHPGESISLPPSILVLCNIYFNFGDEVQGRRNGVFPSQRTELSPSHVSTWWWLVRPGFM